MNFRRVALFLIPVVALGIVARVVRMKQPAIWNLPSGTKVMLAPNGSRLVCDPHGFTSVSIWDVPLRREIARIPFRRGYTDHVSVQAISADGRSVALWRVSGGARSPFQQALDVWDVSVSPPRLRWRKPQNGEWSSIVFVDEDLRVLQGSVIKTFDERGKLKSSTTLIGLKPDDILNPAAFSPDGSLLVDGTNLRVFDARNGKLVRRLKNSSADQFFTDFSFAPDNNFLLAIPSALASFAAPTRVVWNLQNGQPKTQQSQTTEFWTARGHNRIRFDGRVENVETRQKLTGISLPTRGKPVSNIQISRDDKVVIVQTPDGKVWIQQPSRWF